MLKELTNMDTSKAIGMDGFSAKILIMTAPASFLTKIMNLYITSSKFETMWKLAKVCPVFKKGD